jgi:hypothetical protein
MIEASSVAEQLRFVIRPKIEELGDARYLIYGDFGVPREVATAVTQEFDGVTSVAVGSERSEDSEFDES